eukprot:CAMPEP_0206374766 /NCGR_PEP_ID=MMETSP0294-20121207/8497_1 /ASSEMBLY_ACC=CAM_ASM_000327 /TAXON_ID=39354 /ORGANISM="Heterosigma akashiwo, Strain CCMP2393" /LENGTH=96 /DNA_ID=CAMNT_0053822593 /DNA_START=105 /DNA_END=391 /DNA_ORIENTATION=+
MLPVLSEQGPCECNFGLDIQTPCHLEQKSGRATFVATHYLMDILQPQPLLRWKVLEKLLGYPPAAPAAAPGRGPAPGGWPAPPPGPPARRGGGRPR